MSLMLFFEVLPSLNYMIWKIIYTSSMLYFFSNLVVHFLTKIQTLHFNRGLHYFLSSKMQMCYIVAGRTFLEPKCFQLRDVRLFGIWALQIHSSVL